jgi:acylphosphatase
MVARLVHYAGRVQGVGFRVTAAHLARSYPVAGWVRNLPNGRVQLWAEGPAAAVEAFLDAVRSYWGHHVETEQREERTVGGHVGFHVTR